jgi:hypothetical protein
MIRGALVALGLSATFAAAGVVAGNAAMWGAAYATTGRSPQAVEVSGDRIAAGFGGMLGAGYAGFALGFYRRRQRPAMPV